MAALDQPTLERVYLAGHAIGGPAMTRLAVAAPVMCVFRSRVVG